MDQRFKLEFTEEEIPKSNKYTMRFSKLLFIREVEKERKQDHSSLIRLEIIRNLDCVTCVQRFAEIEICIIAFETVAQCSHSGDQYSLLSKIQYTHT